MNNLRMIADIKVKRKSFKQLYLSILAGICISLGCIGLTFIRSDSPLPYALSGVLGGFVFSFGLFTIFSLGLDLFTGNCIFLSSYWDGYITLPNLLRILGCSLIGNLLGCEIIWVIFLMAGYSYTDVLIAMANAKVDIPFMQLFARGILCNIVICLATLMNTNARKISSTFLVACLPVILFVACGFEHSIADIFILLFSSADMSKIFISFLAVLLGNIVGGAIVSLLHYMFMSDNYQQPYYS